MNDTLRTVVSRGGLLVVGALVLLFTVMTAPQLVGAEHSYVVVSNSMQPTFAAGDVVIVNDVPPRRIGQGDVITFAREGQSDDRVTHRVVEVVKREDGRYFRTQGDANDAPDPALVSESELIGEVMFSIPFIGHVVVFAQTKLGLLLLVILPAVLLIGSEIWDLVRTVQRDQETERGATGSTGAPASRSGPTADDEANASEGD